MQKELSAWVDWNWRNENCLEGMAYTPLSIVDGLGYIYGSTMRTVYFSFSLPGDDLELSVYHPREGEEPFPPGNSRSANSNLPKRRVPFA